MKLSKNDYAIINTIKCRPPNNRKPYKEELKCCSKYLKSQIYLFNPKILILLGNTAEEALLFNIYKSKINWGNYTISYDSRLIFKLYHPAALLYNPKLESIQREIIDKNINLIQRIINS